MRMRCSTSKGRPDDTAPAQTANVRSASSGWTTLRQPSPTPPASGTPVRPNQRGPGPSIRPSGVADQPAPPGAASVRATTGASAGSPGARRAPPSRGAADTSTPAAAPSGARMATARRASAGTSSAACRRTGRRLAPVARGGDEAGDLGPSVARPGGRGGPAAEPGTSAAKASLKSPTASSPQKLAMGAGDSSSASTNPARCAGQPRRSPRACLPHGKARTRAAMSPPGPLRGRPPIGAGNGSSRQVVLPSGPSWWPHCSRAAPGPRRVRPCGPALQRIPLADCGGGRTPDARWPDEGPSAPSAIPGAPGSTRSWRRAAPPML